jgi:sugar lactone lactonase YvrE
VLDGDGSIVVADTSNHRIRKITSQGHVSTLAGTGVKGHRDGEGAVALFDQPCGVAVAGDSNVIVADTSNHRILKITPQGHVSTLAGTEVKGHRDGEGTTALFNYPSDVTVDRDSNVIVADTSNNCIRNITSQGHVSTLAGIGVQGHRDGEGIVDKFYHPYGVAVDGDGSIIVADQRNHRIRKITPQGHVSTLVGTDKRGRRDGDSVTASAQFYHSRIVAVDQNGNVIVADMENHCIRCVACNDVTPLMVLNQQYRLLSLLQSSFASDIHHHLFDSGSFHDVTFVVEQERVPAHRSHLSARCEYFSSMFGAGFKEGDSAEIHIEGTSSAAFKALLKYLYTDNMEVDDVMLIDLAKLSDQYQVERLHNHCLHQLFKGITVQNAVMRLVQAHTVSGEGRGVWASELRSTTMNYMTRNFEQIRCNATATLELLERDEHHDLFHQVLKIKCGYKG